MFCESCPAYVASGASAPVTTALTRGMCRLLPQSVPKLPGEWCTQHPMRRAAFVNPPPPARAEAEAEAVADQETLL